ncbi:5-hydroxytryptamine receptor [Pseudoliparis swirei]|uniref:5-hydroxytryptamine receptor n=1 Tax=Pseudoliparis swirei TaxID=2059687 RepID=UPI0024BDA9D7|nr:5-hydroxytryptamine receptor [Pseudoliparis swirei]
MDTDKLIESIVRALMFLEGILGNNWLALRSLPRHKSAMRTNEILFINLAVSNLITNCLVDLPDTIADFAGRWFLGETFCAVFRFCAGLSEASSIYSTFFISAYWYQKLVGSLKRGGAPVQMDSLRLVGCLLAGSWTVALVFSIPHLFFVAVEGGNESKEDCVEVFPSAAARQTYEIFYLTLANALPLAGIVFASAQIVITLLRNRLRIQGHNSDPAKGENKSTEGSNDQSVSTASAPGASNDPESPELISNGVPASSRPSGEPSGHSSALNKDANTDGAVGAPPNPPRPTQVRAKPSPGSSSQVRAAKSVVAVAGVFLVCWLTHLVLRISNNIQTSPIVLEVASYVAASYTGIIPYIFLYGVKKLSFSCKR